MSNTTTRIRKYAARFRLRGGSRGGVSMLHKDILWDVIPASEKRRILSQDECELDVDFLGFTEVYRSLSKIIPKHFTVIDFGCYLAAQCYCFGNHKKYVGVDIVDMERFSLQNTEHYVMSIQKFIKEHGNEYKKETTFAICSYVPDEDAVKMVRENYRNVFVYYPAKIEL